MAMKPLGQRPWESMESDQEQKPPLSEWSVDEETGRVTISMDLPEADGKHITVLVGSNSMTIQVIGDINLQRRYSFRETVDPTKSMAAFDDGTLDIGLQLCDVGTDKIHRIEID